ncbi:DUF6503 family protein [Winogradskyella sp. 3972H.M.0a.05]|uniref:DUF6503 family protein n=1 Tax=Winogradskyella sp. 3972H.M.0a.05 TaxID=2950277 RepID=UPI003399CC87
MKHFLLVTLTLLLFNCKEEPKKLTAQDIIDKSIEVSGGEKFTHSKIEFDFRDKHYLAKRLNGAFSFGRAFKSNEDSVYDILSNDGFERFVNDELVKLEDSMKVKYSPSVNSVHYFSVLPYGLNDKAVNKELLTPETIKEKEYHKIKVTFNEDGGGEDFDDVFTYWINKDTFKVDYLAYSYNESDGMGLRFREAYNERYVNGLRFVDYKNYKPETKDTSLSGLGKAFEAGTLKLLSKIELKNISAEIIN